jgi:hypothetical protein
MSWLQGLRCDDIRNMGCEEVTREGVAGLGEVHVGDLQHFSAVHGGINRRGDLIGFHPLPVIT